MSMPFRLKALIFGHSHVWSLRRAIDTAEFVAGSDDIDIQVLLCGTHKFPGSLLCQSGQGSEYINPALMSALADYPVKDVDAPAPVWLISAVQGNYYNVVGMLDEQDPFDFVLPGYEDMPLDISGQIIPYGAIEEALLTQMAELIPFYKRLGRLGYAGIMHLGAPPPNPSSQRIAAHLNADAKLAAKHISVSARLVRLKLWLAQERLLTRLCLSVRVQYLGAPKAAADEAGFLQDGLCKDAVHGNAGYASLVLQDLERSLLSVLQGEHK